MIDTGKAVMKVMVVLSRQVYRIKVHKIVAPVCLFFRVPEAMIRKKHDDGWVWGPGKYVFCQFQYPGVTILQVFDIGLSIFLTAFQEFFQGKLVAFTIKIIREMGHHEMGIDKFWFIAPCGSQVLCHFKDVIIEMKTFIRYFDLRCFEPQLAF